MTNQQIRDTLIELIRGMGEINGNDLVWSVNIAQCGDSCQVYVTRSVYDQRGERTQFGTYIDGIDHVDSTHHLLKDAPEQMMVDIREGAKDE